MAQPPCGDASRAGEVLPVLYRDEHLIAVHKPPGLLVHRSDLDRHETRFAVQILRSQTGRVVFPAHRLDRGTSGVLLFALDADTGRTLGAMFERREVEKTYLAVVRGWPSESGTIDHALVPVDTAGGQAQEALTRFRRLATVELPIPMDRYPAARYALLAVEPVTGRRHQIRRHLKHIAHPVIGDATHGKGPHNRLFRERLGSARLLLACVELALRHPVTGGRLVLTAPVEGEFAGVLRRLGWAAAVPARWLGS